LCLTFLISVNQIEPNKPDSNLPIGTAKEFRWLRVIVVLIIVLNILDAIFTLFWVNAGLAKEANVLMRYLVHNHPFAFVAVKFSLVLLGTYILWRNRFNRMAVLGMFVIFIIYYALLLHHLSFSSHIFFKTIF